MFRITSLYLDVRYLRTKGQVISKGIFGILNSSKKTYEEIQLNYTMIPQVDLFSFGFRKN